MPKIFKATAIGLALIAAPVVPTLSVGAEQSHVMTSGDSHEDHMKQSEAASQMPSEGGQSAFAAIAEIVALLKADPKTDWATVDIDGLREHLVDMNELTLNATVQTSVEGQQVVFAVSGEGRTKSAIVAMVPVHASVLNDAGLYRIEVEETAEGATMRIEFGDATELAQIKGLGFFGIMASEAHHQAHHWQMAIGSGHPHH